jgi:branched-chain amino acid transport system substrate-binding protein
VVAGRSRSQLVRSARKCLLQPVIPGRSRLCRSSSYRPVTPEVAGSSPAAPVSQSACKWRFVACPGARSGFVAPWPIAAVKLSEGGDANPASFRTIASDQCGPLHYEGAGSPQLLIAADLPLQPGALATTSSMVDAMTLALERREYKAGAYHVGLQVCDEGSVLFDERTCAANAHEYVKNPSVIGVVGPFLSGCATLQIPILNRAPDGPVAIVSPSNTYVGLTRRPSTRDSNEPPDYYPTGQRNYARVLPADDVQAAADAIVARRLGVERVYAVDEGGGPSTSFVDDFIRAARRLGVAVAGRGSWDNATSSSDALAAAIAQGGADGVFLGVPSGPRSVRLLTDLHARLGRATQFMAPDGFDPDTAVLAGSAAEGMTISQPGPASDHLSREGKLFVAPFSKKFGGEPTRYAVNAAQAIDVLLYAIGRSDGTRASVTRNLFRTRVSNGILGSFWITPTGDTTLNAVAIHRIIGGEVTTFATVVVPDALVAPD